MTGLKAIDILSNNTNLGYGIVIEGDTEKVKTALNMAIESLKLLCYGGCNDCEYSACPIHDYSKGKE